MFSAQQIGLGNNISSPSNYVTFHRGKRISQDVLTSNFRYILDVKYVNVNVLKSVLFPVKRHVCDVLCETSQDVKVQVQTYLTSTLRS